MCIYSLYSLYHLLPSSRNLRFKILIQSLSIFLIICLSLWYTQFGLHGNGDVLGLIACAGSLLSLGWPLLQRNHNNNEITNTFSTPSSHKPLLLRASPEFAALSSSIAWTIYGFTLDINLNIIIPNLISAVFSLTQLYWQSKVYVVDPKTGPIDLIAKKISIEKDNGRIVSTDAHDLCNSSLEIMIPGFIIREEMQPIQSIITTF